MNDGFDGLGSGLKVCGVRVSGVWGRGFLSGHYYQEGSISITENHVMGARFFSSLRCSSIPQGIKALGIGRLGLIGLRV